MSWGSKSFSLLLAGINWRQKRDPPYLFNHSSCHLKTARPPIEIREGEGDYFQNLVPFCKQVSSEVLAETSSCSFRASEL